MRPQLIKLTFVHYFVVITGKQTNQKLAKMFSELNLFPSKISRFLPKNFLVPILMLFILISVYESFSPGAMTWDSLEQLRQATDYKFGTWQPPLMAIFWSILIDTFGSFSSLLFFHMCMIWVACLLLQKSFLKYGNRAYLVWIIPFLPWVTNFQFVVWKDVGHAFSWLLACSCFYLIDSSKHKKLLLIVGFVFLIYGLLIRTNSIVASIPLFYFGLSNLFRKTHPLNTTLLAIFMSIACFTGIPRALSYQFEIEKQNSLSYLLFDDLVHVSIDKNENLLSPLVSAKDFVTLKSCNHLKKKVTGAAFCLEKVFEMIHKERYQELVTRWKTVIPRNLDSYLSFRIRAFSFFLRSPTSPPYYPSEFRVPINPPSFETEFKEPSFPGNFIKFYTTRFSSVFRFFYKPYFWLVLSFGLIIFSLRKRFPKEAILLSSSFLYIFSYILVVPAADLRYTFFSSVISSTCLITIFIKTRIKYEKSN